MAPRFHTNMRGWLDKSMRNNWQSEIWVLTLGSTEDYSEISPIVLSKSKFSLVGDYLSKLYLPSYNVIYKNLVRYKPTRIIIRDPSRLYSIPLIMWSSLNAAQIVFYNQEPVYGKVSTLRWLICGILGVEFISPVLGDTSLGKVPYMTYQPFLSMVERDTVAKRSIDFICISKFNQRKRIDWFVNALSQVPHSKAIIVGEAVSEKQKEYFNYVSALIETHDLGSSIEIITNTSHSHVLTLLTNSRVFCLPAMNEPASVSVVDAIEAGCKVICSDTCGTRWYDEAINVFKTDSYDTFLGLMRLYS